MTDKTNLWYLKDRQLHRDGHVVYDRLNEVIVCELSEPRQQFVEHHELELGSKDRDLADEHAQLIMASPYAVRACYKLVCAVLERDFAEGLRLYSEATDEAIQILRQLEGKTL